MLDPMERWRQYGEKPDYAGPLTFGGAPCTQDPAELVGADVAIIGAPMDDLVSDRPGARFAPRAIRAASCPPGPHLEAGVDAFERLRIVDFGDAPVVPAQPGRSHEAIERTVRQAIEAGAMPGDRRRRPFDHRAQRGRLRSGSWAAGPPAFRHSHRHGGRGLRSDVLHGTVMRRAVDAGHVDARRYVQIGLRGYWPGEAEFAWQAERGITSLFMHDVRDHGIREVLRRAVEVIGAGPTFLTVDIDVLDPAYIPGGTGTPEPGGMTPLELLWAARTAAAEFELVGADLVEVIPTAIASADPAALLGDRIVREILTGIALRRRNPAPQAGAMLAQ